MKEGLETRKNRQMKEEMTKVSSLLNHKIKSHLFEFFFYVLNAQKTNGVIDAICVLTELCQLMSFPLHPRFTRIWKYDSLYIPLSQYFQYLLIIPMFKGAVNFYLLFFYSIFITIIAISGLFIYSSFIIKKQSINHLWPLQITSIMLSLFGNVTFLPFLETLLSIFFCDHNNINVYSSNIKCWAGTFYVHLSCSIIGIVVLVVFSIFYMYICCDMRKSSTTNNSKTTSKPDIVLVLVKVYLSLINIILRNTFNLFIISVSFLFTCYLLYLFWFIRPYHSRTLTNLYLISTFILCWGFALLVFGTITIDFAFNGGIPLLFIGIIGILMNIYLNGQRVEFKILFFRGENTTTGTEFKDKLSELEDLCEEGYRDRENGIVLRSYIQKYEDTCFENNCFLKHYLQTSNKLFLYLHIESLYQIALSMYPYHISLQLMYIVLLFDKLNKIRKAKGELEKVEMVFELSLNDSFAVFYLHKLIEMRLSEGTKSNQISSDLTLIRYKTLASDFKTLIIKVASLYLEFWNLLIISKAEIEDDLTKLNNLGSRINYLVDKIEVKIENLEKIRKNDEDVISLYAEFLSEIMNKKDQAYEYFLKLSRIEKNNDNNGDTNNQFDEGEVLEEDFNSLTSKKDKLFIIVSTQKEGFCNITNISLGISSRLGYLQNELINHPLDRIMPEIFRRNHKILLMNKIKASKTQMTAQEDHSTKNNTIDTFALTKSKYILPISFNVILLQIENGNQYFIAKLCSESFKTPEYDPIKCQLNEEDICYILTDKYSRIKNFTSNTIRLLGLCSKDINGSVELTNYFKEFNEEYLHYKLINNDLKNQDTNNDLDDYNRKRDFVKKYFEIPIKTTWKHRSKILNKDLVISPKGKNSKKNELEMCFIVNVIEQMILSHSVGFVYKFEIYNQEIDKKQVKAISSQAFYNISTKSVGQKVSIMNSSGYYSFVHDKKESLIESNQTVHSFDTQQGFFEFKSKSHLEMEQGNNKSKSFQFNKWFVPSSVNRFILDPLNNVYRNCQSIDESTKMRILLKEKAMEHLKQENSNNNDSDNSSESDRLNSFSYDDSSIEEYTDSSNTFSNSINKNNNKEKEKINEIIDDYYHVNLSKIKLLVYDYKKKTTVEYESSVNMSEMQTKLQQKEITLDSISDKYNHNAISQYNKLHKSKNQVKQTKSSSPLITTSTQEPLQIKELLIRQIQFTLKKRETQRTIILFQLFSFVSLLIILGEAILLFNMCLNNQNELEELLNLVICSGRMVIISVISIYYVRELTLLNNQGYTNLYQDREEYIANNTFTLFYYFQLYSQLQKNISISKISLFDQNYLALYNKTVDLQILVDNYTAQNITASIYTSFVFIQLSLFKITQTDFDELAVINKDAYFFIYNSMNINFLNLEEQVVVFINKIYYTIKELKMYLIIFIVIVSILHIGLINGMKLFYNKVANKKKGYLEVFLEINNLVLALAYDKCDKFLNKIQRNIEMNNNMIISEDDMLSDIFAQENDTFCLQNQIIIKEEQKNYHPSKKRRNLTQETKVSNVLFSIIFFVAFCFSLSNVLYYWTFLNRIWLLSNLTLMEMSIQIKYVMAFNILREYIIANHTDVYLQPVIDYTEYMLKDYVHNLSSLQNDFEKEIETLSPRFQENYYNVFNKNICLFATDFFEVYKPDSSCEEMTNKVATYGLKTTLSYYLEEIRLLKSKHERNLDSFHALSFRYNFTLVGTPIGDSYWPSDAFIKEVYRAYAPVNIFNSVDYLTLSFLLKFIIMPAFLYILNNVDSAIEYETVIVQMVTLITIICNIVIYLVIYFSVWKPFEMRLNNAIYKTKNMLSIIPIEVLVSIKNIDILLEIDRSSFINENNK